MTDGATILEVTVEVFTRMQSNSVLNLRYRGPIADRITSLPQGTAHLCRGGFRIAEHERLCVPFGASSHVARFLLAAHEQDPSLRFPVNCRFDDEVERALDAMDGPIVEVDRETEPDPDTEGRTMSWVADRAFRDAEGTPVAVFHRGDVGKEAMTRVLAPDTATAADRVLGLLDAI